MKRSALNLPHGVVQSSENKLSYKKTTLGSRQTLPCPVWGQAVHILTYCPYMDLTVAYITSIYISEHHVFCPV